LNVVSIELPSLAERGDDFFLLVEEMASKLPRRLIFTEHALDWLRRRKWPGNVRGLRDALERLTLLSENIVVQVTDLEEHVGAHPSQT
jgi:two-component system response regulator HydG